MNVPAIRAALERLYEEESPVERAVVRVGLRACDEADKCSMMPGVLVNTPCTSCYAKLNVIADILREAGVEVAG